MKKAIVLCGGIPQVALIKELKKRDVFTILLDMNKSVVARPYADKFYPVSVFDVDAIREIAELEKVDYILTACADQVLLVQAKVSEMLGLPCYITYHDAKRVSDKSIMKKVFLENEIPTSKYKIVSGYYEGITDGMSFPLIVKPVDSYSSRGVRKVLDDVQLNAAISDAVEISRTKTAVVEEFVEGDELTVDVYVEDGVAKVLCVSDIDKIPDSSKFIICRTRCPASLSQQILLMINQVVQRIADSFGIKNAPMLVQMINSGGKVSVVEFCERTGGGDKFNLIKRVSGFDVIKALVDLTMGELPHVEPFSFGDYIVNEFLYMYPCVFDHLEGVDCLLQDGVINDFYQLKREGHVFGEIKSSGDRIAYYSIEAKTIEEARDRDLIARDRIKFIDSNGVDSLRKDLIARY